MTLNALGSLCSKLCEQFTWNCQCNHSNIACCTKTATYYIGTGLDSSVTDIIRNQNLPEAMQALEKKPIPISKVKTSANLSAAADDHGIESIRAGLCQKMLGLIAKLDVKEEEKGNGQSKLKLASAISDLKGAEKYKKGDPLTKEEYSKLKKAASDVQKYYKGAMYIWAEVRRVDFEYSKIENKILKAPLDYFKQKVSILSKTDLKTNKSFWKLQKIAQIILLEASMKFGSNELKVIEEKPELRDAMEAALLSHDRERTKSDDFPKVLLDSQTRNHYGQSYDEKTGSIGKITIPESPVTKRKSSTGEEGREDSPLTMV